MFKWDKSQIRFNNPFEKICAWVQCSVQCNAVQFCQNSSPNAWTLHSSKNHQAFSGWTLHLPKFSNSETHASNIPDRRWFVNMVNTKQLHGLLNTSRLGYFFARLYMPWLPPNNLITNSAFHIHSFSRPRSISGYTLVNKSLNEYRESPSNEFRWEIHIQWIDFFQCSPSTVKWCHY